MIFGKTDDERERAWSRWRRAFAFLPVRLGDGRWLWLESYLYRGAPLDRYRVTPADLADMEAYIDTPRDAWSGLETAGPDGEGGSTAGEGDGRSAPGSDDERRFFYCPRPLF